MVKRVFRFALRLAVTSALLWAARAALKSWIEGPAVPSSSPSWPPIPPPAPPTASAPVTAARPNEPAPVEAAVVAPADTVTWVDPLADGSAPDTHPVKAKTSSMIYHLPGTSLYTRTRPDRCYSTAEAAEADGFARAKR